LVILSSLESVGPRTRFEGEFYGLLVFTALGLMLMAASTDLVLLVLAIEFVSLTSYVLAGFLKAHPKSTEAGVKYFLYGATASAVMIYGFSLLYGLAGTTNLYQVARAVAAAPGPARGRLPRRIAGARRRRSRPGLRRGAPADARRGLRRRGVGLRDLCPGLSGRGEDARSQLLV
ncbi:MAG: proton-conducting transporter membrane subunit, partial [bacterium]